MNRERIELTIDGPRGEIVKIFAKEQNTNPDCFDIVLEEWEMIEGSMVRTSTKQDVCDRQKLPEALQMAACSGISFALLPYPAQLPSKQQAS